MNGLTHFDEQGNARMVDVGEKAETDRIAVAHGFITVNEEVFNAISFGTAKKGDVLEWPGWPGSWGRREPLN